MNILRLLIGLILSVWAVYYFYNQYKFKKYKKDGWVVGKGQVYYGTFVLGLIGIYLFLVEINKLL